MTGREIGYRLSFLLMGGLTLFGFFAGLMGYSENGLRVAVLRRQQQQDTDNDLQVIGDGLVAYSEAHQGRLPAMDSAGALEKALLHRYVAAPATFLRIGDNAHYLPNPALSTKNLLQLPPSTLLLAEAEPRPLDKARRITAKTRAALRADGVIVRLTPDAWAKVGW